MKNSLAMHIIYSPENLEHVKFDLLVGKRVLLILERLVQVHVHEFKDKSEFTCVDVLVPLGSS